MSGATPLQGGVPIEFEGKVIGAIGVSGNTPGKMKTSRKSELQTSRWRSPHNNQSTGISHSGFNYMSP